MASNYTSNYNLCQWAASDKVLRTEFNADNAKIDAAVKAVDRRVDGKADQSALNALSQAVSGKLDLRNCRVAAGSYRGSGEYGSAHPNTLSFPQKPVFLCVVAEGTAAFMLVVQGQRATVGSWSTTPPRLSITWTDRSVSWCASDALSASAGPAAQLNNSNATYFFFAALELE